MTIILGIDPGTIRMGYGIIEMDGRAARYIECGVLSAPASWPKAKRLRQLTNDLVGVFAEHGLVRRLEVACEAGHAQFAEAAAALGEARGIVIGIAGSSGHEVALYPPATVKKAATGTGAASKTHVARAVAARLKLKTRPAPDAADALAVALCHAAHLAAAGALRSAA